MTAKTFTIISGKGGVGTTTASINLSSALAGFAKKTLIIDADVGMPAIGLMLGLETSKATLHDVLSGTAELKEAIYDGPNNLHVLPGSISLHSFVNANSEIIGDILESVREKYDFIILDSPTGINKNSIFSISIADEIIQVMTPDIVSLAGAMKIKAISDNLEKPFRGVLLNRAGITQNELSREKIESTLGLRILETIAEDKNVNNSLAFKSPVVIKYPGLPTAVSFNRQAAEIAGIKVPLNDMLYEKKETKKKGLRLSLSKSKK
ncbi:MAG: cell division ATPase MinD [Methanolobus sp.]|nr:cell division ATPase MinD [Methanolobus sp.]